MTDIDKRTTAMLTDVQWLKKWTAETGAILKGREREAFLLRMRFAERALAVTNREAVEWQELLHLPCEAQHDLAIKLAANIGYVLVPEPDRPDSPHSREWTADEKLGCAAWNAAMEADERGDDIEAKYIAIAKAVAASLETASPAPPAEEQRR